MTKKGGCPKGMYPMASDYDSEEYDTFEEFKEHAEGASDIFNFPISWYFSDEETEYWEEDDGRSFQLIFLMPRKYGQTWGIKLNNHDRTQVEDWLEPWMKSQVAKWYGWSDG